MNHFAHRASRLLICAITLSAALAATSSENDKTDPRLTTFARQYALTHAFEQYSPPDEVRLDETDPIRKLIDIMHMLGREPATAVDRIVTVTEALHTSVKAKAAEVSGYKKRTTDKEVALLGELQRWAANDLLSNEARALRQLIVALRLASRDLAFDSYGKDGVLLQFGSRLLEDALWLRGGRYGYEPLPLRLPCELLARHPGPAVEAFANSGDWPAEVGLTSFLDCPIPNMFSGFPDAQDFVVASRLFQGQLAAEDVTHMTPVQQKPRIAPRPYIQPEKPTEPPIGEWTTADARRWMSHDVAKAMRVLSASDRPEDKLTLALARHVYTKTVEERKETVKPLLAELEASIKSGELNRVTQLVLPEDEYDGSDERMAEYLQYLGILGGFAPYSVPCDILIAAPTLLESLSPVFGGGRDRDVPRADCPTERFSLPASYRQYLSAIRRPLGSWPGQLGSVRTTYGKQDQNLELMARAFPHELAKRDVSDSFPFEAWSMVSLANREIFREIATIYETAHADLVEYYQQHFGLSSEQASHAATVALQEPVYAGSWGTAPENSLRAMILNNVPASDIAQLIEQAGDIARVPNEPLKMAGFYEWAWRYPKLPEPLIMIAVHRPEITRLLLEAPNSTSHAPLSWSGFKKEDLRTGVNAANWFGKTALMTAAQINNLDSAKLLLNKGADIRATTLVPQENSSSGDFLVHDLRTAAMYAAASSGPALIEQLHKGDSAAFIAGDSTGLRPIHYLLGYLDFATNERVPDEELTAIANLINPFVHEIAMEYPASFDCNKAATWDEHTVCDSPKLRVQDAILSRVYHNAAQGRSDEAKKVLLESQRTWLKSRRKCEQQTDPKGCLEQSYSDRIDGLRRARPGNTK